MNIDHIKRYPIADLSAIISSGQKISIHPSTKELLQTKRKALESTIQNQDQIIYGINTGFGVLCDTKINEEDLNQLQINLIRSHSCGYGAISKAERIKWVLLLKIISLCKGASGVRLELVEFLVSLYNEDLIPVVPERGSLGASGDLAPLAHLSLACIAEGKIMYEGLVYEAKEILSIKKIQAPGLRAKEGLALINGTQYTLSVLIENINLADIVFKAAVQTAILSSEAFHVNRDIFHSEIHSLRNQNGQQQIAKIIDDQISKPSAPLYSVQDPYSFRCIAQVMGASLDAYQYVQKIAENEIQSVSDNPLILSDGKVVSGGNFHAQPLAMASDILKLAMAELGSIAERRIYLLVCGHRDLPNFLIKDAGLSSGYMIVQYAAASLVSQNKQLATPAIVDSIVTSKGQEDHVSMATNAALQSLELTNNVMQIVAMEWMTACRAWNFRDQWKLNPISLKHLTNYLQRIPHKILDHIPSQDYQPTIEFLVSEMKS